MNEGVQQNIFGPATPVAKRSNACIIKFQLQVNFKACYTQLCVCSQKEGPRHVKWDFHSSPGVGLGGGGGLGAKN